MICKPIFAKSELATSWTFSAKASRFWYVSSTVKVPKIARRWPSRISVASELICSSFLPRNCSAAVATSSWLEPIFKITVPLTMIGTPCCVYTSGVATSIVRVFRLKTSQRCRIGRMNEPPFVISLTRLPLTSLKLCLPEIMAPEIINTSLGSAVLRWVAKKIKIKIKTMAAMIHGI